VTRRFTERACAWPTCRALFVPTGPRNCYCRRPECVTERAAFKKQKQPRPTHSDGSLETRMMQPQRCSCGAELVISCPNGHV